LLIYVTILSLDSFLVEFALSSGFLAPTLSFSMTPILGYEQYAFEKNLTKLES